MHCYKFLVILQKFLSRQELFDWAKMVGRENNMVVVTLRSEYGKKKFVILGCERGGKYKPYKGKLTLASTKTRKIQCPFKLKGRPSEREGCWRLKVMHGFHNHEPNPSLEGHAYPGRLTSVEKQILKDMVDVRVKPQDMLHSLKEKNPSNLTTIDQIYSASKRYKRTKRVPHTEIQYLMQLLERDKYVYWHTRDEETLVVENIFWAHPRAIELFNLFPAVVLIDSTYKTNRYGFPLLDMVGMTSTYHSFSIAFAFMRSEKTHDVAWALNKLRELIVKEKNLPQVIVTDKDTTLMNAVAHVFPTSKQLLCQFHIAKNVTAKSKLYCDKSDWDGIKSAWNDVMFSANEKEYGVHLADFQRLCKPYDRFMSYVQNTWLADHKEKFVKCWVDKWMHFGNTTTNR